MVDQVGSGPAKIADRGIARVGQLTPASALSQGVPTPAAPQPEAPGGLARQLAASAPVDAARVAEIKRAVAEGRFPISPATVADRLLALKFQWSGNEQA
jgi:negative regulator of flagellin synthesis FlgM